jgi:hypothetical protein
MVILNQSLRPVDSTFWSAVYVVHNLLLAFGSMALGCNLSLVVACYFLFAWLARLAHRVFRNSLLFPIVLRCASPPLPPSRHGLRWAE